MTRRERLYTAQEVARLLGLSARRVRALAASRGVGRRIGPLWVFAGADVDAMRVRVPGRPPRQARGA